MAKKVTFIYDEEEIHGGNALYAVDHAKVYTNGGVKEDVEYDEE